MRSLFTLLVSFLFSVDVTSAQKIKAIYPGIFTEDTIPCFDPTSLFEDSTQVKIDSWQFRALEYSSFLADPVFNPFNSAKFAYIKRVITDYGHKRLEYLVVADIKTGNKDTIITSTSLSSVFWLNPEQIVFLQKDTLIKITVSSKAIVPIRTGISKIVAVRNKDIITMDNFKHSYSDLHSYNRDSTVLRFINSDGVMRDSIKINAKPFLETDFSKDSFWVDAQSSYPAYNVMKYKTAYKNVMPFYNQRNIIAEPHYMKWNPLKADEWYMFNGHNLYRYNLTTDSLICLKQLCRLKSFGEFDISSDGKWILAASGLHIHTIVGGYCENKSQLTLIRLSDLHEFIYVDR